MAPPPATHVTGRLVIQPSGATITIPPGKSEAFIGREDPVSGIFPEIDLDPHGGHDGGVGRKHAKLFLQGSQLMIEDLDSVNGTLVNKQKLTPGQPLPVTDGVELRFGKVVAIYVYCRICGKRLPPKMALPKAVNGGSSNERETNIGLCSACGYKNMQGETFCAQCGVHLPPVVSPPPSPPSRL
jgi:pSer/pThr/pTyr-binding forkhead associated (FHA) protein